MRCPASLLVLGGGVVGVEMAWAYASLGAARDAGRGAAAADRRRGGVRLGELVREALEQPGVTVVLGRQGDAVARAGTGEPTGRARARGRALVRRARSCWSRSAGAAAPPISGSSGSGSSPASPVEVDDTMRVPGHDWLYVVGDANGRALLTHMGKYQARLAADHILGRPADAALRRPALAARDLHRAPGRGGRATRSRAPREAGSTRARWTSTSRANAGGSFVGHGAPGTARFVVDERPRRDRRRDVHGRRGRGVAARGDHRGRRRGADRAPVARGAAASRRAARCGSTCSKRSAAEPRAQSAAEKISSVPRRAWSLPLPSGSTTWPSTTIGLFQWPAAPGSLAIARGEPGR